MIRQFQIKFLHQFRRQRAKFHECQIFSYASERPGGKGCESVFVFDGARGGCVEPAFGEEGVGGCVD